MEKSPTKKFLIDGFPRNEDNLSGWNKQMAEKTDFKFVLFFECGEQVGVLFLLYFYILGNSEPPSFPGLNETGIGECFG